MVEFLGQAWSWTQVVLGVGMLIFIHELGHFLVAKWCGVRVLAFSLGFGPEMVGFTRGPTRYRVSWVPLGGYVKMSGENEQPGGGYAPDDYPARPIWQRSLIIVAGVAMNALLGFLLFAGALGLGMETEPVVVGTVQHGEPAWEAGIRPGDRILRAGGERLLVFPDLMFATMEGAPVDLEIERDGAVFTVRVEPRASRGSPTPAIGVVPAPGRVLKVPPGGTAAKAGFRDGDVVVALEGIPAGLGDFAEEVLRLAVFPEGGPLRVTVENGGERREIPLLPDRTIPRIGITPLAARVDRVLPEGPAARAGWETGDVLEAVGAEPVAGRSSFYRAVMRGPAGTAVRVLRGSRTVDLPLPDGPSERLALLRGLRFAVGPFATSVEVAPLGPPGPGGEATPSPAAAAGIPTGARITTVQGKAVGDFADIATAVQEAKGGPVEIGWTGPEGPRTAVVTPVPAPLHGLGHLDLRAPAEPFLLRAEGPGELASMAWSRCRSTTRQILSTVKGIFRGSVDSDNLGGPILIAQVAHKGTQSGFGHFLWILAVLSINLMFLNVLPIPLLDGGQLALLGVEAVTRRPPSEAVVGISQMVGLVLLLGLMVMVTFNDVARLFGP